MKKPQTGGYRLQYVEIYNWGTFDKNIWKLTANGKNSLLTGANGSGKTTLVDAIITLLVPPTKRHYNQSSGAASKKERNEKTYTLGAYGRVQSESGLGAKTKYLRNKDDFSILLGTFYNPFAKHYVTLLQVRWFSNNDLRKAYFIAPTALTIEEHLQPLDTSGVWKKKLKKRTRAEEFDSFTKYSQAFARKFGLKSDKALSLFAQTVGIKVLGNLNDFIRTNMLEEHDAEAEFVELREHYENLLSSHKSIEKAREQVRLLEPIVEGGKDYHDKQKEVKEFSSLEQNAAPYFAQKRATLLESSVKALQNDTAKKANQITDIKQDLEQLIGQRTDLQISIGTNKVYEQVQNLDKQIQQTEREREQRQQRANRYNKLAEKLDLKTNPNERTFYKSLDNSRKEIETIAQSMQELQEQEIAIQVQQKEEVSNLKITEERLASLQKRKNRIPLEQINIREGLLSKLKLTEKDLPFAAELIKIKEEAKAWETTIEQALRPLSLSLLIPEEHYDFVIKSLTLSQLNGKIYFRKVTEAALTMAGKVSKKSLINHIEIQKNHPYTAWLENILRREFNFEITKGYATISNFTHSLSDKGLIKNYNLHERDDSPNGSRHIMGWDNRETILEVQKERKELLQNIKELQHRLSSFQKNRKRLSSRRDNINRLLSFEQFGEIDWKSLVQNIKQYEIEKEKLLNSSNQLQELENQLAQIKLQINDSESSRDRLTEQRGTLQNRLDNYQQQLEETQDNLKSLSRPSTAAKSAIEAYIKEDNLVVSTILKIESRVTKEIQQQLQSTEREAARIERKLTLAMQKFISPSSDILEKYPNWTADTYDLQPDIKYLREFELIYTKIQGEDLPKYQKRFKDWLNERLIFDIANFKTSLENKEVTIEESIQQINSSLLDINFNSTPLTYIQLDIHKTRDSAVREFKEMLRDAMPDPAKLIQGDDIELEKSFKRIQKIIEELSNNETWRRKVTDVRNWLEFAAIERFRSDDSERQYYMDSQSLSGGEKAKLAYTILASAIAYQFGIRNNNANKKSFRFAVVDEAFSKVDPENSIYAMELFKQLNLQLMVVTPLDKINLAEPYIHAVHFVQNSNKKNSEVYDLPMEVYQLQKETFREIEN